MNFFNETINGTAGPLELLRAAGAFLFIFIVPGLAWSLVMFRNISVVERLVVAVGLSLALVTLAVLGLNIVFHVKITLLSMSLVVMVVTVLAPVVLTLKYYVSKRRAPSGSGGGEPANPDE